MSESGGPWDLSSLKHHYALPASLDKVLVVRGDSEACVRRYTLPTRLIAVRFFQV